MPLRQLFLATLLLTALTVTAEADELAIGWLQKMVSSMHELNYDGVFVYTHGGHLQSMRIVHGVNASGERERLVTLSGPSREVIRDSEKVVCYLPDDKSAVEEPVNPGRAFPYKFPENFSNIAKHYTFRLSQDGERVAGQPTRVLEITSRDDLRYGHKLWLAADSGFLLRAELLNESGSEVERLMFTSIEFFDELPESLLQPELEGREMVWQRSPSKIDETVDHFNWRVGSVPSGFILKVSRRHPIRIGEEEYEIEHQVFSDGLSSISIFVEPEKMGHTSFEGASSLGAVSAFARVEKGLRMTVVGEVPLKTAEQVAGSIVLQR